MLREQHHDDTAGIGLVLYDAEEIPGIPRKVYDLEDEKEDQMHRKWFWCMIERIMSDYIITISGDNGIHPHHL